MIMKSSSFCGIIINIVIVLYLSIQITKATTVKQFFAGDESELLELGEEVEKPRFFFGNNGSLILDTRTTLILAALFGPLLAAIPILLALLGGQGNDSGYGGHQSGYGGGQSGGYGGGGGSGSSGGYGGYGYARNTAVEAESNKQQRNFKKRSPMEDYESSGEF